MPFLLLLYIVAYLDRINVGFAALQMKQQLGFSDKVYGLGAGIFFLGYFLFQLPSNLILHRVGPTRWIAFLMILWGCISSAMMLVSTANMFYALRFLLGAAEAGFFPGVILYLRNWFPPDARARSVALFMTAGPISGVLGGPISGALLNLDRWHGLAGWQWLFALEGIPAVVLGFIAYLYLVDRPEDAPWLSGEQRSWLRETLRAENPSRDADLRSRLSAFRNPRIWLLAAVYCSLNTASYGMSLWLPTVFHRISNLGNLALGFLTTIPYLAAMALMILNGAHSDRTGERRWHVAAPAIVASVALALAGQSFSPILVVFFFTIAFAGVQAMSGPFWAIPSGLLSSASAAAGIALVNSVGNLGSGLGPYLIGWIRTTTGSFAAGLLVVATILCLGGVLIALLPLARRAPSPRLVHNS
jgi:ACS family tartrate transporter-like MFS transporter